MKLAVYQGEGRSGSVEGSLAAMRDTAAVAAARVALLCGYPEWNGKKVYNSALLVNPAGGVIANYRKTHLYGGQENRVFKPGDPLVVADLDGLKIGILICYDVESPEAVRALAVAGAELIAVPTALMEPFSLVARTVVPARAYESQLYVAYIDLCGREGNLTCCGLSCIVGPNGEDLERAGKGDEILIADIDPVAVAAVRKSNPNLPNRRPNLYAAPVKINPLGKQDKP